MPFLYEIECTNCKHFNDINETVCGSCGFPIPDTINVKRAKLKSEVEALTRRYESASLDLKTKGLESELNFFESEIIKNGKAVINTNFIFLWEWLIKQSPNYTSYRRQIINNDRPKAKFENDVRRSLVDSILFGSTNDIIYSALSIDERGLISYGEVTVILKVASIENRTSALETNSFFFIEWATKNGWTVDKPLPSGYMAIWSNKHKLAVAKLSNFLKKGLSTDEIATLILNSTGDRSSDVFIELYIYGKIVKTVIEKIKVPNSIDKSKDPRTKLKLIELSKKFDIELY